jgi:putative transposase
MVEEVDRTVKEVARDLGISADLLYKWRRILLLPGKRENESLKEEIINKDLCSPQEPGSLMITANLHVMAEYAGVNKPRIACLLKLKRIGLKCRSVKKFKVTTDSNDHKSVAPDHLERYSKRVVG